MTPNSPRRTGRRPAGLAVAAAALLGAAGAWAARGTAPAPGRASHPPAARTADLAGAIAEDAPLPVTYAPAAEAAPTQARLIEGPMETVLYGPSMRGAAAQAIGLIAHERDLTRDLALGDRVRLLERPGPDGRWVLDYLELDGAAGSMRLYRRTHGDGEAVSEFVDAEGSPLDRRLLRTPLAVARVTSGFGMRLHPLLGYTRLHRGVDFAAEPGTPVLAAGDGVIEGAGWAGGYGRLVRLRHAGGIETLYAHLSAWAPGVIPGGKVRQGQTIGWSGATGRVTGPHLHFELIEAGQPVDPARVRSTAPPLAEGELLAFQARKAEIDARLARAG